jgi:deazaflavin-dependent oxidoreductase (nitroreductase family)
MAEPGDRIEITPRGTRGARTMWGSFLPRLFKPLLDMQISEQEDGTWLVVGSKSGASTHPAWFINLAKNPDNVWLEVGNRKLKVLPSLLKGKERAAALARIAAISPRYAEYQNKTDREIPIVCLRAS